MRNGLLAPLGTLLAGAGLALAQSPSTPIPASSKPVVVRSLPTPDVSELAVLPVTPDDKPAEKLNTMPSTKPGEKPSTTPGNGSQVPVVVGPECATGPGGVMPFERPDLGEWDCERDFDFWVGGEFLVWYAKQDPVSVPLLTTGPAGSFGILNQNGVVPVAGLTDINYGAANGARVTAGAGISGLGVGLEATGFILEKKTTVHTFSSDLTGTPTLARPVINSNTGAETSSLIASPGAFQGSAEVRSSNQMWGTEANIVRGRFASHVLSADMILGFRYIALEESLTIAQQSTLLPGGTSGFNGNVVNPPATLGIADHFATRNQFYGGQIGTQAELHLGNVFIYSMAKIALGGQNESIRIVGASSLSSPGTPTQIVPGGLLALASNSGTTSRNAFAYIPEVNVNVGYQFGKHLRVYAGYTFLYWDDVARPGAQIQRNANPTQIPTSLSFGPVTRATAPLPTAAHSDFWIQGVSAGVIFRY